MVTLYLASKTNGDNHLSRYEPANARYFQVEINCGNSMVETVKLLGCFEADNRNGSNKLTQMAEGPKSEHRKFFQDVFVSDVNSEEFDSLIQGVIIFTCEIGSAVRCQNLCQ